MGLIILVAATSEKFAMERVLSGLLEAGFSFEDWEGNITFNTTVDDYEPICLPAAKALTEIASAYREKGFVGFAIKSPFDEEGSWLVRISGVAWSFQKGMSRSAYHPQLLEWARGEVNSFFRNAGISYQISESEVF